MPSKTSFFNATAFRKNLIRFAPVWGLYALCLVAGLFMEYTNYQIPQFWFAYHMGQTIEIMGLVNAGYALLVAQLLFGDLYSSRMCNMLHALPLRREGWFVTNLASALVMSLIPTAIMTIFSWVLLANTIFQNAWVISLGVFVASNLEFLLFFGIAAFAAMCTGNRFAMAAGYGLLNFGARIGYFLVDTVYTPMLYGVITPLALVRKLTPLESLMWKDYFTTTTFAEVMDDNNKLIPGIAATFQFGEGWLHLLVWTVVGLVFLALALVLYRKRQLECAGDAVAFPILKPVFNIFCTLFVTAAAVFVPCEMFGVRKSMYLFLALGLVVGWFVGKMLLERSTRVFRLKNWYGLAVLGVCMAVTLGATKLDVLGIETYIPDAQKIEKVWFSGGSPSYTYTEPEDIAKILRLQELALADRAEGWDTILLLPDGSSISYNDAEEQGFDLRNEEYDWTSSASISLFYTLKNGKEVKRTYGIWVDGEAGDIVRELTSRWDVVNSQTYQIKGQEFKTLDLTMENFRSFGFYGSNKVEKSKLMDIDIAWGLIEAIQKDCAEGTMCQESAFHTGYFRIEDETALEGYVNHTNLWVDFYGERYTWYVEVYPECRNTIAYLQDLGLLNCEIIHERLPFYQR